MPASFLLEDPAVTQRSAATDYAVDVLGQLPRLSRQVLALHYVERMTMAEIAQALGLSEVRVRRVHDQALARVKSGLAL